MLRRLALGLAVAAVAAPMAQARVDQGTGSQAATPAVQAAVIHGDDKVLATRDGSVALIHGDDKVIVPQPGSYSLVGYRRALPQDYGAQPVGGPVETVSSPDTFNWGDAFAGAGAAFALMLLAGAAVLGTRRSRPTAA